VVNFRGIPSGGLDVASVNWAQPWLRHLEPVGPAVAEVAAELARNAGGATAAAHPVSAALVAQPGCPVGFVPPQHLPPGEAYEAFIRRTGQVPTRDNLHDFFNGLAWLRFPLSKARLNQLQAEAIAAQGVGAVRGPVRDAITVFDENGALLLAPPGVGRVLWPALLARDWHTLFVTHRVLWAQARLVLFGHALMEQLVSPRKPITAHVWVLPFEPQGDDPLPALDADLAAALSAPRLAAKPFTPLPVLGVPGWWPANEDPAFYADASVFRPAQKKGLESPGLDRVR
jgi:hypothetical protein